MKLKQTLTNLVAASFLFLSTCAMPQRMDEYRTHPEKYHSNYSAAILVAKPTAFYDYLAIPFMGIYETRVANALKTELGVDSYYFVRNAEWKDLESALLDDKIKVIVVAGHGENYEWAEIDNSVVINLFLEHPEIKKDWFIRHTCGSLPNDSYIPRDAIQKIQKELNKNDNNTDISINWHVNFITCSYFPLSENFQKLNKRVLTSEGYDSFIKIQELTSELNEKIKKNYLAEGNTSFGYIIVEDPSHVLGWDRITTPQDFLLNPLPGLDEARKKE